MSTTTFAPCFLARGRHTSVLRKLSKSKRTSLNQIAYEGEWAGHPAGEFQFTREIFEKLIENFNRRSDEVPLTYGHPDGETAAYMGAAGWIRGLSIGTDDAGRCALFADMEFTERAAGQVRNDEHRRCSVVVGFESVDEKSGEPIGPELFEVGLVLSAFIDGMRPLAAGRHPNTLPARGGSPTTERKLAMSPVEILKSAIDEMPEDASLDQILAYVQAEQSKQEALEGGAPDAPPAEDPEGDEVAAGKDPKVAAADAPEEEPVKAADDPEAPKVEAMDEESAEMADEGADGMAESAVQTVVDEIVAAGGDADAVAVAALIQECAPMLAEKYLGQGDGTESDDMAAMGKAAELEAKSLKRQVAKLSKQVKTLTDERQAIADKAIADKVDAAIESGAFESDERADLVSLGKSAPKQLDTLIAKMSAAAPPKGLPMGRKHKPSPASGDPKVDDSEGPQNDDERAYVARLKKTGTKNVALRLSLYRDQVAKREASSERV